MRPSVESCSWYRPELPPPRARHPLQNIDSDYLETKAYKLHPDFGKVYDWRSHHENNKKLESIRKHERRAEQVRQAADKESEHQRLNQEDFVTWKRLKQMEEAERKRAGVRLPTQPWPPEPVECFTVREAGWKRPDLHGPPDQNGIIRQRVIKRTGFISNL